MSDVIFSNGFVVFQLLLIRLGYLIDSSPNFLFSDLLDFQEDTLGTKLMSYINKLSKEEKDLLKEIIIHIDKNY